MSYITFNNITVYDPGTLYPQSVEQNLPLDFWKRANAYTCPLGAEPGDCWLLMLRKDIANVTQTAGSSNEVIFRDSKGNKATIKKLYPIYATCMTSGEEEDENAAYLLLLRDKRHFLKMSTIGSGTAGEGQYNVRYPAPPGATTTDLYYSESLNSGALWTWATLLSNIWGKLPSGLAGSAPSLPYTPDGSPEGFRFIGVSAWDAYNAVLDKIGCAIAYDPLNDAFTIVQVGKEQSGLSSSLDSYKADRVQDWEPIDNASARAPEKVRVCFHRRDTTLGFMHSAMRTGSFSMRPIFSVDKSSSASGAVAGTIAVVWDDMPAIFDIGTTFPSNSSALNTRATEVAANYVDSIVNSDSRVKKIFAGVKTGILPGSQVKAVTWRDYGDGNQGCVDGIVTEITRFPGFLPTNKAGGGICESAIAERLEPPDLGRATEAIYPIVGKPTASIAAASGGTPGSGTVTIWRQNSSGVYTATSETGTGLNIGQSAIPAGVFVEIVPSEGGWIVVPITIVPTKRFKNVEGSDTVPADRVLMEVRGVGDDSDGPYLECGQVKADTSADRWKIPHFVVNTTGATVAPGAFGTYDHLPNWVSVLSGDLPVTDPYVSPARNQWYGHTIPTYPIVGPSPGNGHVTTSDGMAYLMPPSSTRHCALTGCSGTNISSPSTVTGFGSPGTIQGMAYSAGLITVNSFGYYAVIGTVCVYDYGNVNDLGTLKLEIYKNGSSILAQSKTWIPGASAQYKNNSNANTNFATECVEITAHGANQLNAGNTIELKISASSGSNAAWTLGVVTGQFTVFSIEGG